METCIRSCIHLAFVVQSETDQLAQRAMTLLLCSELTSELRQDFACAPSDELGKYLTL
jgi:hypothetical protein